MCESYSAEEKFLSVELHKSEFAFALPGLQAFEIPPDSEERPEFKNFISDTVGECSIAGRSYFGVFDEVYSIPEQRVARFDNGLLAGLAESQ